MKKFLKTGVKKMKKLRENKKTFLCNKKETKKTFDNTNSMYIGKSMFTS